MSFEVNGVNYSETFPEVSHVGVALETKEVDGYFIFELKTNASTT